MGTPQIRWKKSFASRLHRSINSMPSAQQSRYGRFQNLQNEVILGRKANKFTDLISLNLKSPIDRFTMNQALQMRGLAVSISADLKQITRGNEACSGVTMGAEDYDLINQEIYTLLRIGVMREIFQGEARTGTREIWTILNEAYLAFVELHKHLAGIIDPNLSAA